MQEFGSGLRAQGLTNAQAMIHGQEQDSIRMPQQDVSRSVLTASCIGLL